MKNVPLPSLQDVLASKYRHIPLSEEEKHELIDLHLTLYKAASRLTLANNVGDAYSALMTADSALEQALETLAQKIRRTA